MEIELTNTILIPKFNLNSIVSFTKFNNFVNYNSILMQQVDMVKRSVALILGIILVAILAGDVFSYKYGLRYFSEIWVYQMGNHNLIDTDLELMYVFTIFVFLFVVKVLFFMSVRRNTCQRYINLIQKLMVENPVRHHLFVSKVSILHYLLIYSNVFDRDFTCHLTAYHGIVHLIMFGFLRWDLNLISFWYYY